MPEPIAPEDQPFRHYSLKHRVVAYISVHLFDNVTYTVRHGLLKGKKRRGGLGWVPGLGGADTEETLFWRNMQVDGKIVYDVGAFQGLVALYFSSRAKQVICFEPNPNNYKRLQENLALNQVTNVTVRRTGVGSKTEVLRMAVDPLMPGGASVAESMQSASHTDMTEIPITTLDEEIPAAKLPPPDLIKIDIEGWELEALKGARQTLATYKPDLYLEMHGETIREKKRKVAEIVEYLWQNGYRRILHVESGKSITPDNSADAMEGHLFCQA